jgi:hypothetical protein
MIKELALYFFMLGLAMGLFFGLFSMIDKIFP